MELINRADHNTLHPPKHLGMEIQPLYFNPTLQGELWHPHYPGRFSLCGVGLQALQKDLHHGTGMEGTTNMMSKSSLSPAPTL